MIKLIQKNILGLLTIAGVSAYIGLQGGGLLSTYGSVLKGLIYQTASTSVATAKTIISPEAEPSVEPTTTPASSTGQKNSSVCKVREVKSVDKKLMPTRIDASSVDISLPIRSVPLKNGTWAVYDYTANFAEGTSLLTTVGGNVGLFGHDRPQAFARIKQLKIGDTITVLAQDGSIGYKFYYRVEIAEQVQPNRVDTFYPTDAPIVTLVTCNGLFSQQRYVVKAALEKVEEIDCQ